MLFNRFIHGGTIFLLSVLGLLGEPNQFPESSGLSSLDEIGFFAGLTKGDNRKVVLEKLQSRGFLGYKELQSNLIKSPIRWAGHAYELTCKFEDNSLSLCLIQGEAGWQDFFYNDIVQAQWQILRNRVDQAYGQPKHRTEFPDYWDVPLNDKGGYVTDRWNLKDRTLLLTVQTYTKEDCCTKQVLDFSCCTLLIEPK